jgi:hypothetical protein
MTELLSRWRTRSAFTTRIGEGIWTPSGHCGEIMDNPSTATQFVGYFPKTTAVPGGWMASDRVAEICSVSNCINSGPDGWIDKWLHNELGFFNTRTNAVAVTRGQTDAFEIFAYRLLPRRFNEGKAEPVTIPQLQVESLPSTFVSLGFDAVSKSVSSFFECSPLSCNNMAAELPVNRFCLLETLEEAIALAERCSRGEGEPGPYYVLEVLREPS